MLKCLYLLIRSCIKIVESRSVCSFCKVCKQGYARHLKADLIDWESKNTITFVVTEVFINEFVESFDVGEFLRIEGAYVKRKVRKDGGTNMWTLYANVATLVVKAEGFDYALQLYYEHKVRKLLAAKGVIEFAPTIAFVIVQIEISIRDDYRLTIADGHALSDRASLMVDTLKTKGSYCVAHNINVFKSASTTLFVVDATLFFPLPENLKGVFSQHLSKQVSSMGFGKKVFGSLEIININSLEVEYVCSFCKGRNVSRQICNLFCYFWGQPVQIVKVLSLQAKINLQNCEAVMFILQGSVIETILNLPRPFLTLFDENLVELKSCLIALTRNGTF
ncbi:hypothetical protein L7F22_061863 [Adiantum nelumboides]|nr:hypothetical protein [Adiantum nelumboides]